MGDKAISSPFDFLDKVGSSGATEKVVQTASGPVANFLYYSLWVLGSIGLIAGIYYTYRIHQSNKEAAEKERAAIEHRKQATAKPHTHVAWENIINSLNGSSEAEWRLAIMDADSLLDTMLMDLGYQGIGVGEKLKSANPASMRSLEQAWEAHKIRNRIAHDGQDFSLSQREAQRVVYLYETVFREFGYI